MKVDRNQLVGGSTREIVRGDRLVTEVSGIPLRLEIASRCMAAILSGRFCDVGGDEPYTVLCLGNHLMWNDTVHGPRLAAKLALEAADAMIESHNATCGEVAGE